MYATNGVVITSVGDYLDCMWQHNPRYTTAELLDGIRYKLIKENCIPINNWNHQLLSHKVLIGVSTQLVRLAAFIELPVPIVSIDKLYLRSSNLFLHCEFLN